MKRTISILALAAALTAYAPMISAQAPGPAPDGATTPTVNLTVEQRHVIKEFVKDMKVDAARGEITLTVGGKVPNTIQQHQLPPEVGQKVPQVRTHTFFLKDNRIVLVNPRDATIADVIE